MVSINVNTIGRDGQAAVGLRGELDLSDAATVAARLAEVVASCPDIIVDLAGLDFIDCCGLWVLAAARDQALATGGDLLLSAPTWLVLWVLALTGLADVFSVHASVEQAEVAHARRRPM